MASEQKQERTDFEVSRPYVPPRAPEGEYPLIDSDPHFKRVMGYMRPSDLAIWAACTVGLPGAVLINEKFSPTNNTHAGLMKITRMNIAMGLSVGFIWAASRSSRRFYGARENAREVEMDMREMTDRAKKGLPLYGESRLSEYMQGMAARNSRYSGIFLHAIPVFNFVNHPHHGVDTAKYYQNAERELEAGKK